MMLAFAVFCGFVLGILALFWFSQSSGE